MDRNQIKKDDQKRYESEPLKKKSNHQKPSGREDAPNKVVAVESLDFDVGSLSSRLSPLHTSVSRLRQNVTGFSPLRRAP